VYGFLGVIIVLLVEINFFLKIQPFANWYFLFAFELYVMYWFVRGLFLHKEFLLK